MSRVRLGGLGGPFWLVEALAFLPGFPLPQRPGLGEEIETCTVAAVSQFLPDLLPLAPASSQLGLCRASVDKCRQGMFQGCGQEAIIGRLHLRWEMASNKTSFWDMLPSFLLSNLPFFCVLEAHAVG